MEQGIIRSNRWNEAAKYGIIFGLISAAYLYFGHLQNAIGATGIFGSVLGFIVWAVKFTVCIRLMKKVMLRFALENPEASNNDTFKLGFLIAIFSALLFSVITVADQLYIFTDYYQSMYAATISEYAKILPSDQVDQIREMMADAPKISFIGTFIYCALFGTVLSFILSRNIPSRDPFSNNTPEEQ